MVAQPWNSRWTVGHLSAPQLVLQPLENVIYHGIKESIGQVSFSDNWSQWRLTRVSIFDNVVTDQSAQPKPFFV